MNKHDAMTIIVKLEKNMPIFLVESDDYLDNDCVISYSIEEYAIRDTFDKVATLEKLNNSSSKYTTIPVIQKNDSLTRNIYHSPS